MPETTTPITLQEAFTQATEEQSAAADQAPPVEASTADATTTTTTQDTAEKAGASATTTDGDAVMTDAEFRALQTQFPDDPAKQRAALNKAWTQKTQALSAAREKIAGQAELLSAIERGDPETVKRLATQAGLTVSEKTPATTATETVEDASAKLLASFAARLGSEYDFLAPTLAPAVMEIAQAVAQQIVATQVAPLKEARDREQAEQATKAVTAAVQTFETTHADHATHRAAMLALSAKLPIGPAMEYGEYLELLYHAVGREQQIAEAVTGKIDAMNKAAKGAGGAERTAHDTELASTLPAKPTLAQAWAEATKELRERK